MKTVHLTKAQRLHLTKLDLTLKAAARDIDLFLKYLALENNEPNVNYAFIQGEVVHKDEVLHFQPNKKPDAVK